MLKSVTMVICPRRLFLCHKTISRRPILHGHKSHLCSWWRSTVKRSISPMHRYVISLSKDNCANNHTGWDTLLYYAGMSPSKAGGDRVKKGCANSPLITETGRKFSVWFHNSSAMLDLVIMLYSIVLYCIVLCYITLRVVILHVIIYTSKSDCRRGKVIWAWFFITSFWLLEQPIGTAPQLQKLEWPWCCSIWHKHWTNLWLSRCWGNSIRCLKHTCTDSLMNLKDEVIPFQWQEILSFLCW